MQGLSFLSVFLLYILAMILIGWLVSGGNKTSTDFLLGGRKLPFFLTLGSTIATMVGTGSSMGAVSLGYTSGWAGMLYGIGGALGILLLAYLYAPVRELKFVTMSEELSYYVGANTLVKNTVAVLILIASIGWLGAHILGGAMYLAWVTKIPLQQAKLLIASGFAIYVIIGGYLAVVWTDTIQAVILFVGFLMMLAMSIVIVGDWQTLISHQPSENISFLAYEKIGVIPAISLIMVVLVGVLATPSYRQRIYSGRDVKTIQNSFKLSGLLYLSFCAIPAIIGMAAFALNPTLTNANFAFPYLVAQVLPASIGIIVLIAGLSATMSSASSDAIASVAILSRDIAPIASSTPLVKNNMIRFSRLALAVVITFSLLLALLANDIVQYITSMIATLMSGLFTCSILGRFWQRFNWQGAMASLLAGSLASILILLNPQWLAFWGNPILPSLVAALSSGILISLLTKPCLVSPECALNLLTAQRAHLE